MKAIISKYVGSGNVRGPRYIATDQDGNRVLLKVDDCPSDEMHEKAVRALCAKLGWEGVLVWGTLMKDGSRVWVWLREGKCNAEMLAIGQPLGCWAAEVRRTVSGYAHESGCFSLLQPALHAQ